MKNMRKIGEVNHHDGNDWTNSLKKIPIVEDPELIKISKKLLKIFKNGIEREGISKDFNSVLDKLFLKKEIIYQKEGKTYFNMLNADENDLKEIKANMKILKSKFEKNIKGNSAFNKKEIDDLSGYINILSTLFEKGKILKNFHINYSKIQTIFLEKQILSEGKGVINIDIGNVTKNDLLELENNIRIIKSKFKEEIRDNNIFDINIRKAIGADLNKIESIIRIISINIVNKK